jgi:hypothetical protein
MTLVFALIIWIGQLPSFPAGCVVGDDRSWMVFARPRPPKARSIPALVETLNAVGDPICYRDGTILLDVPTATLRTLFGTHVALSCVRGAGNTSRADGYFGRIERGYVPAALQAHAARLWIEDDPKFRLVESSSTVKCPRGRKR